MIAKDVLELDPKIRYVAVNRDGAIAEMVQSLPSFNPAETDRMEELLVNPVALELFTRRGNLDLGGVRFLIVRYGLQFQVILPLPRRACVCRCRGGRRSCRHRGARRRTGRRRWILSRDKHDPKLIAQLFRPERQSRGSGRLTPRHHSEGISTRLSREEAVALDRLASRWNLSPSRALRKLVQASSNDEAVAVIEQATFVRYPTLPKAWKYRFLSDFSALVGVDHLTFKRGSIVTRDGISPQLIEKLYARNAMLEPLPDMLAPLSD